MDAQSLVSLFGQEAGVSLALGTSGTVALAFEAGPTVQIEHDAALDALHCYIVLGRFPADAARAAALARMLLQGNAFGRDTDGASLGLDAEEIVLSRRLELSRADTTWLRSTVESLVSVALEWQPKLEAPAPAAPAGAIPFNMPHFGLRV